MSGNEEFISTGTNPYTVDFEKLISAERIDSQLSTLISANLNEVALSLVYVNKYTSDKAKNQAPTNEPKFRDELEPVRYIALDPAQGTSEDGFSIADISGVLSTLTTNDELIGFFAARLEPMLTAEKYDPVAIDKEIRNTLIPNIKTIATQVMPDGKQLIAFALNEPGIKGHDFATDFSSMISMSVITAVNEKNASLGRKEEDFPLKNYFPQYFAAEPSLTTAQNNDRPSPTPPIGALDIDVPEEALNLAKKAFDSASEGQSPKERQESSQLSANVDSRKKAPALD